MQCFDCGRTEKTGEDFINGRCGNCYSKKQNYSYNVPHCKVIGNTNWSYYNYKCPDCTGEFSLPALKISYDQNDNGITEHVCPFCDRVMEGL